MSDSSSYEVKPRELSWSEFDMNEVLNIADHPVTPAA